MDFPVQGLSIRAQSAPWYDGVEFLIFDRDQLNKTRGVVSNIEFTTVEEAEIARPTLTLPIEVVQMLFNDLWQCGLRPTIDKHDSPGELRATKEHLKDLQKLVFNHWLNEQE